MKSIFLVLALQSSPMDFDWSLALNWQIVSTVLLGAVSGYVASKIIGGDGFGFLGNIVVGVIGGLIGSYLIQALKIPMMSGFFGTLISSVGGALVLIFFIEVLKFLRKTNSGSTSRKRPSTRK
jgi:uncharacterized membrane protein YeaQ/YmgE (transglycosylase-associated protein family)